MKTYIPLACVSVVALCCANSIVTAQLITLVSQDRYASVNSTTQSSTDFGSFNASVSYYVPGDEPYFGPLISDASQNSQINASPTNLQLIASGAADAHDGRPLAGDAWGDSYFSVTFTIAVPCSFSLTGESNGAIQFSGPNGPIDANSGVLTSAGQYVFSTSVGGDGLDGFVGSYNVDLALTAVPEPSTVALVGLGLTGLLFRRHKGATAK
jgi:hypothetical protein